MEQSRFVILLHKRSMEANIRVLYVNVPKGDAAWYWTTYVFSGHDEECDFSVLLESGGKFEFSDDNFGVVFEQTGHRIFRVHAMKTSKALGGQLYFNCGSECIGPITVKSKMPALWDDASASAVLGEQFRCAAVTQPDLSTPYAYIEPWCGTGPQLKKGTDGVFFY